MNDYTRNRAGLTHPNAVVARHELERQERSRLTRLSQMGPRARPGSTPAKGPSTANFPTAYAPYERNSQPRPRAGSRPGSASASRPRSAPSGMYIAGQSLQPSNSRGSLGRDQRRGASASATMTRRQQNHESMLSPQVRLEEAQCCLGISTEDEDRALREELQSWYFGGELPAAGEMSVTSLCQGDVSSSAARQEFSFAEQQPAPIAVTSALAPNLGYAGFGQHVAGSAFAVGRAHVHAPFAAAAAAASSGRPYNGAVPSQASGRKVPVRLLEDAVHQSRATAAVHQSRSGLGMGRAVGMVA